MGRCNSRQNVSPKANAESEGSRSQILLTQLEFIGNILAIMKTFPRFLIIVVFLFSIAFSVKETGRPKIYDCFLFFNEIELLKIRMHTLYDHVDKFVLVESAETHQGKTKPLCFEENKELFSRFADKIIYVPLHEKLNTDDPRVRENYQRNQIVRGLKECNNHDIILISDLDEIADPKCFNKLRYHLMRGKRSYIGTTQKMYTYFLNRFSSLWHGTVATTYRSLKDHSLNTSAIVGTRDSACLIRDGTSPILVVSTRSLKN